MACWTENGGSPLSLGCCIAGVKFQNCVSSVEICNGGGGGGAVSTGGGGQSGLRLYTTPCQSEIIHKAVIHVLYAYVYMLRIHLMYNLCSRSKYTCYPLWCITRVALDV